MVFRHTGRLSLDHRHARPSFPPTPDSGGCDSTSSSYFAHAPGSVSPTHSATPGPSAWSKVQISSLAGWQRYFHPVTGILRANHEDGAAGEAVRHLVIDVRYIIAEDEYEDAPKQRVEAVSSKNQLVLPNVWKLTMRGAEFAECTDSRAKALAEVIAACGKEADGIPREGSGVVEVEWLHVEPSLDEDDDATRYAATFTTNLVHDKIVQAGTANWGKHGHGATIDEDEQEAEEWRLQQVVTPLQKGLKRLALQGGFVMPNPSSCSGSEAERSGFNPDYTLQPQFRFAFEDWVGPGGLDVLAWSFRGNYTTTSVLAILRNIFQYVTAQVTSGRPPFRALVLDHLPSKLVEYFRSADEMTMARAGLSGAAWTDPAIKSWLVDTTFVIHEERVNRLWSDDQGHEDAERERQFHRLKADMVAVQELERAQPQPPFLGTGRKPAKHTHMSITLPDQLESSLSTHKRKQRATADSPLSPPLSRAASSDSTSKASSGGTSSGLDSLGMGGERTGSTQTSVDGDEPAPKDGEVGVRTDA